MILQNYLQTSRSLAKLNSLGDIRESTANGHIVSSLLDITSDSDCTNDQIYIAALALIALSNPLVSVQGGKLPKTSELAGEKVADFQIGMYPVTYEEWQGVRNWAVENGFDIAAGTAGGPKHPVTEVCWYDCVKWCNAKSEIEGLDPVYSVKGHDGYYCKGELGSDELDILIWYDKSGYRLPTEAEWEWAARGGRNSQGYTFAGSNNLNDVGWYVDNSAGAAHAVGQQAVNELGLHDLSGNVWEWCGDVPESSYRRDRGGSWASYAACCAIGYRVINAPDDRSHDIGFRLACSL
jgi:formylglycine-generating enzyme required for sulfatase activity